MKKSIVVLLVCSGIYILSMFHRTSTAVLAMDIMKDFHFSQASIGLISGVTLMAYGLMQLPSGILADRIGAKRTLVLLTLITGVAAMLFTMADILPLSLASRFCVGIGISVAVPGYALLAQWYPRESYARAVAFMTASGALGIVLSGPPLAYFRDGLGWVTCLQIFAGLTLLLTLALQFGIPGKAPLARPAAPAQPLGAIFKDLRYILTRSRFWFVSLWSMFTLGTFFTLSALWWVPYLVDTAGFTVMSASYVLFCAAMVQLVAGPLIAWLSDVVFRSRRVMLIAMAALCAASLGFISLMTGRLAPGMIMALCMVWAFGASAGGILYVTILKENFPDRVGTAIGCANVLYPVWAAVLQPLFGWLLSIGGEGGTSYTTPMVFLFANVICGLICACFVKETWSNSPSPATGASETAQVGEIAADAG